MPSNPLLERLGAYPLAAFQDLARALGEDAEPVYDLSLGDPVEPTPAFVRRALVDAVEPVSRYPTAAGLRTLREAVAAWVRRRFDVDVDPDAHVLPTAGSKEGIFHTPLAVLDPHGQRRAVVWGAPGYQPYERGAVLAGGESDRVDLTAAGGWRLEIGHLAHDRLSRAAIVWVNHPHNPTGATVDLDYYRRSLAQAREHGFVLGSDECYVDIHPPGAAPPPSLLQACDGDLTGALVAFSLSKRSGMTGYRSGAFVGDPEVIRAQRVLRPNLGTASPEFVQHAAIAAWGDDAHVADRRDAFEAKRRAVLPALKRLGIERSGSEATFYLWLRAPGGDDVAYATALLEERIVLLPGSAFGAAGRGWLRVALAPGLDACRAAAERWVAAAEAGRLPA